MVNMQIVVLELYVNEANQHAGTTVLVHMLHCLNSPVPEVANQHEQEAAHQHWSA